MKAMVDTGALGDGNTTMVQPEAMEAPSFLMSCRIGKLNGVMAVTTPTGSWRSRLPDGLVPPRLMGSVCS